MTKIIGIIVLKSRFVEVILWFLMAGMSERKLLMAMGRLQKVEEEDKKVVLPCCCCASNSCKPTTYLLIIMNQHIVSANKLAMGRWLRATILIARSNGSVMVVLVLKSNQKKMVL
ncbi:hypothetical protein HanRHA438_Chr05g0206321 [Helianthus annuus]|uniref:Uncharacterized protein n=1 Tax=Helianthus annuus TaxID=4232 RepID=A0A9K3IWS4_HELAN|nr:uncharacterized protein LOC110939953 isoform X1 [Helianthus annuus]KAF5804423.1 hypothetical protein HanXRQr2_Chr05g0196831 [Helianthus annuus]KAJ0569057.1 hypothetical protein HanHA300_Chr05g0161731 [Helianthus annuus]KAJ0583337.1 hypothetical protein HanHA89_Chr05g0175411 [Helianthus annuus]KAJ0746070.1 hypothetical protein HanOQP8_Chr05g0173321 [Helianthus annuus]KAJ0749076.1 hypothetical protein HanLR1_Chr05g0165621 [Helianthus annuus]